MVSLVAGHGQDWGASTDELVAYFVSRPTNFTIHTPVQPIVVSMLELNRFDCVQRLAFVSSSVPLALNESEQDSSCEMSNRSSPIDA